jgi:integrase
VTPEDPLARVRSGDLSVLAPELESARDYAEHAKATNTLRMYAFYWKAFQTWCEARQLPFLPAAPQAIAAFLASYADEGKAVSTIGLALAGIRHFHEASGHPWIIHPALKSVMQGIRRVKGRPPERKTPVSGPMLQQMVESTMLLEATVGLRNRALILLGWFGAFRRSELVSLDVEHVQDAPEGLSVLLPRSKTDQTGQGRRVPIPFYAKHPQICPVRAVRAWLSEADIHEGAIFRGVSRSGKVSEKRLTPPAVAAIVKKAVGNVGQEQFGGHSLRSGLATRAAKRGKSLDSIMRQTGHHSADYLVRDYIRPASLFQDCAAADLFTEEDEPKASDTAKK